MHIGNIRLPNVFEKGPVTVKMPIYISLNTRTFVVSEFFYTQICVQSLWEYDNSSNLEIKKVRRSTLNGSISQTIRPTHFRFDTRID